MRIALLTIILAFVLPAYSQCPAETTLFFANGMFNSKVSAKESLEVLKNRVSETENWKRSRSQLAYNYDEIAAYQVLVVFEQKMGDFDKQFWRWMWNFSDAPKWFQDQIKLALVKQDGSGLQSYGLSEQVAQYEHEMSLDRSIVVVAHSQGNFFANNASLVLQTEFYPASSDFRIISVATPSAFVSDEGPYFTLKSDGVIGLIPAALPANVANTSPAPGLFDHRFIDHYLYGKTTGDKIIESIQSTLKLLSDDAKKANGYNKDCWQWLESLHLSVTDSQECTIKCSVAKNDFSNMSCNSLCESYCGCRRKRTQAELKEANHVGS